MTVLIAADKFKGSLTAKEVCEAIGSGIADADQTIEVIKVPLADGGEGTSLLLTQLTGGETVPVRVRDPLGRVIVSSIGISTDKGDAFLEMASASGLTILPEKERNPAYTSTVGTGDLILAALDAGAKRIILGIGGSATNDVGTGMAHALGFRFFDRNGNQLEPNGENLFQIDVIDRSGADPRVFSTQFIVLCDVSNPLYGADGASRTFGPQKEASPETVEMLERNVTAFAGMVRTKYGFDLNFPGGGAAGGLGAGAKFFLGATIHSGISFILDYASVESLVGKADLIITGEGKADSQSISGKVVAGVSKLSRDHDKPLWLVTGKNELGEQDLTRLGISKVIGLVNSGYSTEESQRSAFRLIRALVAKEFKEALGVRPI
jgi:glycerate kinase